jgi:hypothetical protein
MPNSRTAGYVSLTPAPGLRPVALAAPLREAMAAGTAPFGQAGIVPAAR